MIYVIDKSLSEHSHSKFVIDIIKRHTDVEVKLVELSEKPTFNELYRIVQNLIETVCLRDIVLCPWAVDANSDVDDLFNTLSDLCWVIAAAGNFNKDIQCWSPARAERVITVACLNKSGVKAVLSNYSKDKDLIWVPGTNYDIGWKNSSGTSVSAAIYAAFLAESIKKENLDLLDKYLEDYKTDLKKSHEQHL